MSRSIGSASDVDAVARMDFLIPLFEPIVDVAHVHPDFVTQRHSQSSEDEGPFEFFETARPIVSYRTSSTKHLIQSASFLFACNLGPGINF